MPIKKMSYANNKKQPPIMQEKPTASEWRVDLHNWDSPPFNRWAFSNCREFLPTANIAHRPDGVLPLATQLQDLGPVSFTDHRGKASTLQKYIDEGYTDAYLILHRGKLVYEQYRAFTNAASCHLLQSVGKSIIGVVAQRLKADGVLDPAAEITSILPELKDTGYRGGATVQQAMDMSTGINFEETYISPLEGDCYWLDVANGWKPAQKGAALDNLSFIKGYTKKPLFPHGQQMIYRCIETDVITHCLEKLTQRPIAELISEYIWQPMGAEADAYISLDSSGYGIGSGGISARARDMVRFGLMMISGGNINGRQLLPERWVDECYNPEPLGFDNTRYELKPCGGYKNFFWIKNVNLPTIL
ncbi:MAG: serine hydrolase, partial [Alphaproteobacteria bacterium]|nr:serine hydrolase [Alphaproteobacteria bacterium]